MLAIVDICACLMISLIIMDLSRPYKYTSDIGCKIHSFSKFFTAGSSILLLFTIAVERYRKICCPFKRQLSMKGARIFVCVDVIVAIVMSVAQTPLYEVIEVKVENEHNITVTGFSCLTTRNKDMRKYLTVMNGVLFFLFIIFSVALIVLYILQSRAIYRYGRKHARLTKSPDVKAVKEKRDDKTVCHPGPSGESSVNNNQAGVKETKEYNKYRISLGLTCEMSINSNQSDGKGTKHDETSGSSFGPNAENTMNNNKTVDLNPKIAATEVSKRSTFSLGRLKNSIKMTGLL